MARPISVGEGVARVPIGAELGVQPRVQFVENLLDAVGQASAGQNLEGTPLRLLWASVEVTTCLN